MSDASQATADYEARYKELQAEFTRKSQRLAELEAARQQGQLVDRSEYDRQWQEHIANEVRKDPEAFLASAGVERKAATVTATSAIGQSYPGYDESIFADGSPEQQRFVAEYGQRGFDNARLTKLAPEILRQTGLDKRIEEVNAALEEQKRIAEELRQQTELARQYAESSLWEARAVGDPILKKVTEEQKVAKENPDKWWRDQFAMRDELEQLRAKAAAAQPPANGTAQSPVSATEQARRLQEAQSVPASAGAAAGAPDSRPADPLDAIIQRALERSRSGS